MPIIDIDGTRVAYEDAGTGLPIVFIPGLVGGKDWFTYQLTGLSQSFRVISYDLRPASNRASYKLDLLTEDLARFLSALRLQSAVVAGHSFGAMVAQRFALTHRDRTDAVVLISAFPRLGDAPAQAVAEWLCPGPVELESAFQAVLRRFFRQKRPPPTKDPEGTAWLAAHCPPISRATFDARLAIIRRFDSTDWLADIEAPTVVIVGACDHPQFLSSAQVLYEGIPDCRLEVVEDGDHFCFYTRHDIVSAVIHDLLTERPTRF